MSDGGSGTRPGGLTALAVLNFVFGGIGALLMMLAFAAIGVAEQQSGGEVSKAMREDPNALIGWLNILLLLATAILLIVSGVGYLGQKRFLGRTMGNTYAIVSLASSVIGIIQGGFGIGAIIFMIYPLLTLMLINGTFKDDLVN